MTAKVIDASAFAAASFRETTADAVGNRLDGHELHAPQLLRFEMINICCKKIRAHPDKRALLLELHEKSLDVPVMEHDVDATAVVQLAERLNLSGYDASYLWLAREMGAELVTLDERLEKAAAKI